jgi:glucose-1-phosphate thymidylyltransferase
MIDLLKSYLGEKLLFVEKIKRGNIWFDLGSPSSLLKGANYVKKIQARNGELIGSPEFVANKMNIDVQKRYNTLNKNKNSSYYSALNRLFNVSD